MKKSYDNNWARLLLPTDRQNTYKVTLLLKY